MNPTENYLTIASKANDFPLKKRIEFRSNPPVFPIGLTFHEPSQEYRAARYVKGERVYIASNRQLEPVLDALISFNIAHALHTWKKRKQIY